MTIDSRPFGVLSITLSLCCAVTVGCSEGPSMAELTGGTQGFDAGGRAATGGAPSASGAGGRAGNQTGAGAGGTLSGGAGTGAAGRGSGGASGSGGSAAGGGAAGSGAGSAGAMSTGGESYGGRSGGTGGRSAAGGSGGAAGASSMAGAGGAASGGRGGSAGGPTSPGGFPAKFAGNIDTRGSIRTDFPDYWDQFSPENAGKWGSVQPNSQSEFNWSSLDKMYAYANEHNIVFKQHTFVWGSQQPKWTDSLTTSNGPAAVQNWMNAFCERYPNTRIIDVVNEPPPHTTPKYLNAIGGSGASGWDWIVNAFKWARAACPNSILVLNDYNNVEQSGDVQHTIDIVNAIKKAGAPIDAVGCQTHAASNLSAGTLKSNIDKISSSTGLPVYITEYDLNISDDAKQASVLKEQFTMFWENNNVKGITYWGYIVGSTWVANSGLIKSDGTKRPAMTWLLDYLDR